MNTYQRKQLSRLILPGIIILAMIVLIITAKRRDARAVAERMVGAAGTTTTTEASSTATDTTEASSEVAEEETDAIPTDGDAVDASELEIVTTLFDGQVAISFVELQEDGPMLLIRIDNNSSERIQTQGHPTTIVDGTDVLLNPLGKNGKLQYVDIPVGTYHIIEYKVDAKCLGDGSLVLEGSLRQPDVDGTPTENYSLTIR